MIINEALIKGITSSSTFEKGKLIYKDEIVEIIQFEENENNSIVKGKIIHKEETHYCSIVINKEGEITKIDCDCRIITNFFSAVEACEHIVALLFKIEDTRKKTVSQDAIMIANSIRQSLIFYKSKKIIKIELILKIFINENGLNFVELKVKNERAYLVKDIGKFIKNTMSKNGEITFTKDFTLNFSHNIFSENNYEIISVIYESIEIEERFNMSLKKSKNLFKNKRAYITNTQTRRILELYEREEIEIEIENKSSMKCLIKKGIPPFEFLLNKNQNGYILKLKEDKFYPISSDYEFIAMENVLYKIDKAKALLITPILKDLSIKKQLEFTKIDLNYIYSYIIPTIKRAKCSLDVDNTIEEEFFVENFISSVFFDIEGESVIANIKFTYGDKVVHPFNIKLNVLNNSKNNSFIRDIDTETSIIAIFNNYNFYSNDNIMVLNGWDSISQFLNTGLQELKDYCQIYYSNKFKNKILKLKNFRLNIDLSLTKNNLLGLKLYAENFSNEELMELYLLLKERKTFHKLKELEKFKNIIEYLNLKKSDIKKDNIILPENKIIYINSLLQNDYECMNVEEKLKNYLEKLKRFNDEFVIEEPFNSILRKYQKVGVKWMANLSELKLGGILADEMGLGKTIQTISLIKSFKGNKDNPSLIIAPSSLIYNWKDEIDKFDSKMKVLVMDGARAKREEKFNILENYNIIITSYPLIKRDIDLYECYNWNFCILDEAQNIKNSSSMNAKSVKRLHSQHRIALTGTPIENSIEELWSIFDFVIPGYLMDYKKFYDRFESPIVNDKNKEVLAILKRIISPFILRRLKENVVKELPPKIEHKILIQMTDEQEKVYKAYENAIKDEIVYNIKNYSLGESNMKILAMITKLRQICCDPKVLLQNYNFDNGKMLTLDEVIQNCISSGSRVLLFSQFTTILKSIEKRLNAKEIETLYLDGNTKIYKRTELVKRFNNGEASIFLISLKAGGTGLNLTSADRVIHYDPWWNPAVEDQASDRAHRIGQEKVVEVLKFITKDTIEERIYELQRKKKDIVDKLIDLDLDKENFESMLNEDDLKYIFNI
ncbi:SNF2 helicase associated domain-containing protein [Clostridium sediminicola]|uniref:DEAD/DEAH box helicase n=1 Tax=Clostridium sediminicola TaxID=3114879 RepID=UPI0031F1ECDA